MGLAVVKLSCKKSNIIKECCTMKLFLAGNVRGCGKFPWDLSTNILCVLNCFLLRNKNSYLMKYYDDIRKLSYIEMFRLVLLLKYGHSYLVAILVY